MHQWIYINGLVKFLIWKKKLLKHADEYGISLKKYIPNKTYYKREDGKLFIMNQRNMQPYTFIPLELEWYINGKPNPPSAAHTNYI